MPRTDTLKNGENRCEIDVNQHKYFKKNHVCSYKLQCNDSYDGLSLGAQQFEGRNHQKKC